MGEYKFLNEECLMKSGISTIISLLTPSILSVIGILLLMWVGYLGVSLLLVNN